MRKTSTFAVLLLLASSAGLGQSIAGSVQRLSANLTGYQEVPAVATDARGTFTADANLVNGNIRYHLVYRNLAVAGSTTAVTLNFAQPGANGGVLIVLCDNKTSNPCPTDSRVELQGRIGPSDLKTINGQNVAYDDFDKFERALFAGKTYVQVQTTRVPTGEIRGQITPEILQ